MNAALMTPATMPGAEVAQPEAPQHMRALAQANRIRLARAALKRSVAQGDLSAASVVRDQPPETESMTLAELLTSQRRWGRTRSRKFLGSLALGENKSLGALTPRQRTLLYTELEAKTHSSYGEPLAA